MEDSTLAVKSLELLQKDLGIEADLDLQVENPFGELHAYLTTQIRVLLDRNFDKLLNSMYRIDISETKFKAILNFSAPEKVASELANAIIDRERQKVLTRIKYS
ncbi:MAG: hypothetical protein RIC35_12195 [Marinoscillum sp.]